MLTNKIFNASALATRLSKAADCSQQTCRLGSADLLSLVTTAEKVSSGTQGVMSFNSRRRLHQLIELTPLSHRADFVI